MLFITTEKKRGPIHTYSHLSGKSSLSLFFSFSPILLFFFFFLIYNSKSRFDANAKIVIFELENKKEVLWFFRAGTRDLQTQFPSGNRVFKTRFASEIESNKLEMLDF